MDSNLYFYYGVAQQWLIANGAKAKKSEENEKDELTKVKYIDDLKGVW